MYKLTTNEPNGECLKFLSISDALNCASIMNEAWKKTCYVLDDMGNVVYVSDEFNYRRGLN